MLLTNITITAYCACVICCGPHSKEAVCANGKKPIEGITVAASRSIPFGTHIRVQGMTNDFVVMDRLAHKYDNRIDIYFKEHNKAKQFGIKHKNISTTGAK
jgi:3D (Asp-Asp-Asp) domain-containing protein